MFMRKDKNDVLIIQLLWIIIYIYFDVSLLLPLLGDIMRFIQGNYTKLVTMVSLQFIIEIKAEFYSEISSRA